MSHIENNRPYPVTAGYQKSVTADRPGPGLCGAWSRNLLRRNQAKLTPTTAETLSTKPGVFMDKSAFETVLSTKSAIFMDKIESTGVSDIVPQ